MRNLYAYQYDSINDVRNLTMAERMAKGLAGWMLHQSFEWDWWACFTTDDDHEWRGDRLARGFEKYVAKCHPHWAYIYVIEPNRRNNGTHLHVVVGNTKNDSCVVANHEWREIAGNMWSEPFDFVKSFAMATYILKYSFKGRSEYWNIKLPDTMQQEIELKYKAGRAPVVMSCPAREKVKPVKLRRDRPGRLLQLRLNLGVADGMKNDVCSIGDEINEMFRTIGGCRHVYQATS